jgi:glycosyltransferase involved in cell wall biosynthesis
MRDSGGAEQRRFRVGIDMHVVHGIFQGSRTHCLELFSRVVACTPECDFVLLTRDPRQLVSFSHSFALPNVEICVMPERAAPVRLLWQLPTYIRQKRLSLLHTQYIVPPLASCATAVTVHDILFESHPQYFEKSLVMRSRLLVPFSIRRSAAVFTVSEFSRKHICNEYSIPFPKVNVIPNGVDATRFFPGQKGLEDVMALGLESGNYYLTVGRLEPRKNQAALLKAWALLESPRPRLVIVGQRHFGYSDVFDLIRTLGLEKDVSVLEQISDAQIPAVYRNAKGFMYCSWAEGFGMPLLEAMASGIPVVSSNNTGLAEVCADAAVAVNPSNPEEIRNAVLTFEKQPDFRNNLIQRGLMRAREYSWERSAQTVRSAYLNHFRIPRETENIESVQTSDE